jgi:hypothetical protein
VRAGEEVVTNTWGSIHNNLGKQRQTSVPSISEDNKTSVNHDNRSSLQLWTRSRKLRRIAPHEGNEPGNHSKKMKEVSNTP